MSAGNYEGVDIRFRSIVQGAVVLVVGVAVIQILVWFTYASFRQTYGSRDARVSKVEASAKGPPAPRLEIDPTANFDEYERVQMKTLNSYAWVSREGGKARIPIQRAMELLLERK